MRMTLLLGLVVTLSALSQRLRAADTQQESQPHYMDHGTDGGKARVLPFQSLREGAVVQLTRQTLPCPRASQL